MIADLFLDFIASLFGDGVRHQKWWLIVCAVVLVAAGAVIGSVPILVTGVVVLIGSAMYAIVKRGE
jgi:hypothetical protein